MTGDSPTATRIGPAGRSPLGRLAHRVILRAFRAPRMPHPPASARPPGTTAVRIAAPGGRQLFAWHLPVPERPRTAAIVLMHGWGANAGTLLPLAGPLQAAGWEVLLPDARCHGLSDDDTFASLPRFAEDIGAAVDWLRGRPGAAPAAVALVGHSVGAAAALLYAADRRDLAAVVSLSAFAHPEEVMRRWLAARRVPMRPLGSYVIRHVQQVIGARFDAIAPIATIGRIACPLLLVHGAQDTTVPPVDAGRLLAAAPGGTACITVPGGHDLDSAREAHLPQLVEFLRRCLRPVAPPADAGSPAPPRRGDPR